ncbi:hypothetical protein ROSI111154_10320 [Rouxiella silvae]
MLLPPVAGVVVITSFDRHLTCLIPSKTIEKVDSCLTVSIV